MKGHSFKFDGIGEGFGFLQSRKCKGRVKSSCNEIDFSRPFPCRNMSAWSKEIINQPNAHNSGRVSYAVSGDRVPPTCITSFTFTLTQTTNLLNIGCDRRISSLSSVVVFQPSTEQVEIPESTHPEPEENTKKPRQTTYPIRSYPFHIEIPTSIAQCIELSSSPR